MLIVGNGRVITRDAEKPYLEHGAVAIDGDTIVAVGDEVIVKVREIDDQGRLNLSRRDALIEVEGLVPENDLSDEPRRAPRRDNRGGRDGGRRDNRGGNRGGRGGKRY